MIILIVLQALYASVSITNKTLLCYCNPFVFAGFRMMIAAAFLACYGGYNRQIFSRISWAYWPYYVYLIVCGVYAKYALKYWGLSGMSALKMACLFQCTPFVMAALSWIWDKQRITAWQLCGLLSGFLGMLLLIFCKQGVESLCFQSVGMPESAVLLAIVIECVHLRIKKFLVHEKNHSSFGLSFITHGCGGVLSIITILALSLELPSRSDTTFYGLFFASALLGSVICNNLYLALLKKYSAMLMTYSDYLLTIFVAVFSWLLFAQQPPWQLGVSMIMTFTGLLLLLKSGSQNSIT